MVEGQPAKVEDAEQDVSDGFGSVKTQDNEIDRIQLVPSFEIVSTSSWSSVFDSNGSLLLLKSSSTVGNILLFTARHSKYYRIKEVKSIEWDDDDVDSLEGYRDQVVELDHIEVGFPGFEENEEEEKRRILNIDIVI